MRITKKIFTDLAIYMVLLGVLVGVVFPFFVTLFQVPREIAFQPVFFGACIAAGILLALLNIALARRVVGVRVGQLSRQMKHVEEILSARPAHPGCETCSPENCCITVDSQDELGESADSFNQLVITLSEVLQSQADLQQFSEMLTSHLELSVLADQTLRHLIRTTQASGGALFTEHGGELCTIASHALRAEKALADNALVRYTMKTQERQVLQFPEDIVMDSVLADYRPRAVILEPVVYKQVLVGVVLLAGVEPFSPGALTKLSAYGPILSMALNNAITHQQMQQLAALDSLTGIYNRRFGYNRIQEEFGRAIRAGSALSLIMVDIDHFKVVNDTYGHVVGDKVIVLVTKTITGAIREGDLLVRYGGEEFLCVLPGASQHDAQLIAERIRIMVRDSILKNDDQEIRITVSLGAATYPNKEISDIQQLVNLADDAMYNAKQTGRDRVVSV